MNNARQGGIGENPIPYDFSRFKEYDQEGKLITNEVIEKTIDVMKSIYANTPAFTSYSKAMVDEHVRKTIGAMDVEERDAAAERYAKNDADYLAVVRIENGFFEAHKIVIKKININANNIQTEYSATDNAGAILTNLGAIEYIVNNIVLLLIYEDVIRDEISLERERRL